MKPGDLESHKLWWSGPPAFVDSEYSFDCSYELPSDLPETKNPPTRSDVVCAASQNTQETFFDYFINKYSNLGKAQRVLAYVLRFCQNLKSNSAKVKENFITHTESDKALLLLIKNEQNKYFSKEISS